MDFQMIFRERVMPLARQHARELVALAFCLLVVHDVFGQHGLLAMRRSQKEAARIGQELNKLDEENRRLANCVSSFKNDPRAIERAAREDMHLAKPGELIFKLPPGPDDTPDGCPAAAENPPEK